MQNRHQDRYALQALGASLLQANSEHEVVPQV